MNYETPDGAPEAEFDPELESWLELARQSNNRNQLVRLLQAVLGGKSGHHRIRQPYEVRITPAMAAKVTDHVWSVEELVAVVEASLPKPGPRGPYKKRTTPTGA